jgi:hypothetical protein
MTDPVARRADCCAPDRQSTTSAAEVMNSARPTSCIEARARCEDEEDADRDREQAQREPGPAVIEGPASDPLEELTHGVDVARLWLAIGVGGWRPSRLIEPPTPLDQGPAAASQVFSTVTGLPVTTR